MLFTTEFFKKIEIPEISRLFYNRTKEKRIIFTIKSIICNIEKLQVLTPKLNPARLIAQEKFYFLKELALQESSKPHETQVKSFT